MIRNYLDVYLQHSLLKNHISLLDRYLSLLMKWNKIYNLTAIVDEKDIIIKHVLDSLSVLSYLQGISIIDVGTGAGFPGMPLAIASPEKRFTLLDSDRKKTNFLTYVIGELRLNNVSVVHHRIETYQSSDCFDTVITRAFSSLEHFLLNTQHLCCRTGVFLAMKGHYPEEELAYLPKDFVVKRVIPLKIPNLIGDRHLVCLGFEGAR